MYDVIIIGAGPAGLTAALYALRANKKVLVLEANTYGGQIANVNKIDNYPANPHISGFDFATNLYNQVLELGANVKFEKAVDIEEKKVITEKGEYTSKSIIIAIGTRNKKLNVPGEKELLGKGVSYCATCDGMFFKDKTVCVVGDNEHAISDALYLKDICKKVYFISNTKEKLDDIEVMDAEVISINGNDKVESVTLKVEDEEKNINVDGVFIEIGQIPENNNITSKLSLDENGFIKADENLKTNLDGVYVAGDIRVKNLRQLVTAASDGAIAAVNAIKK